MLCVLRHNINALKNCFAVRWSGLQINKASQSFSNVHIWKQDWENQRIHIQTHFSSFCHVKSWIQCLYQSCSSSFKRYALLLYTMLSSSSWNHSITPQTFWFYLILIFMFPVSKSTVFVLPIAFAAFINQSFALLNSQTPNSYLL